MSSGIGTANLPRLGLRRQKVPKKKFSYAIFCLGSLAACLAWDLSLRPFSKPFASNKAHYDFAYRQPSADVNLDSQMMEVREYREGIARSHFTVGGARLTGSTTIPYAPVVLV